jgi:hypothetical protein
LSLETIKFYFDMQNPPKSQVPPMRTSGPLPGQRLPGGVPRPGQPKPMTVNQPMEKPKFQGGFMPVNTEEVPVETKPFVQEVKQQEKSHDVQLVHHQQTPSFEIDKQRSFSFNEKNEDPEGPTIKREAPKPKEQPKELDEDNDDGSSPFTML